MVWEIALISMLSSGGLPPDPDYTESAISSVVSEEDESDNIQDIVDSIVMGVVDGLAASGDTDSSDSVDGDSLLTAVGEIYNGTISTTILDYFDRLVIKLSNFSHYVLVRDGQYSYTLYYGDISLSDTVFSGSCDSVNITTYSGSSGYYAFSTAEGLELSLDVSDYLVYSDLGLYPALGDSSQLPLFLILYVLILVSLCAYLWRIWKFELRGGGSYAMQGKDAEGVV